GPRPAKRDFAAEEEAGRRLTNAHIQLRRGLTAEAEASVRAILAEHPHDAGAYELLGDIQTARDDWEAAGVSYQSALHYEPGRVSAEAKFGKATMRRAERQRQETLGVAYAATETAMVRRENGSRGAWPVILGSALCPGLGQVVQGQTLKGAILIGIFLLGLGLLTVLSRGESGRTFFGPAFWIVNAVLTADWIYAVADAAQASSRGKD
ncbi:MAG TPA: hypothetical protein VIK18_26265, partial [Pirellulales bacterium]